jgi:hypothetical protein
MSSGHVNRINGRTHGCTDQCRKTVKKALATPEPSTHGTNRTTTDVRNAAAYFFTNASRVLLFWLAFILTRPLGATLGDLLDKPLAEGGWRLAGSTPRRFWPS